MNIMNYTFEFNEKVPDATPLGICGSDTEVVERCIGGVVVPGGADTKAPRTGAPKYLQIWNNYGRR